MFKNWKKSAAKTAAIGAVAMGLTGGMAFQQAAPAQALVFLAPLAPVIGSAIGGTGITAGGWALLAGGAAAIGSALHFSTPDANGETGLDRAIDWLMEPVDIFGRPLDENGAEKDGAKEIMKEKEPADPFFYDPNCTHPDCPKEPWSNPYWVYRADAFKTGTITIDGRKAVNIAMTLKGQNRVSGGAHRAAVMVTLTCRSSSGAVVVKPRQLMLFGVGHAYASYDQHMTQQVACLPADGVLERILLETPTREEYTAVNGPQNAGPIYRNGGPGATVSYELDGATAADGFIRTEVVCRDSAGVETTISADSPTKAPALTIPSCASRGLGEAVSVSSDIYQGGTKMKNIFNGAGASGLGTKLEIRVDGQSCQVGWAACESWAGLSVVAPERVKCYLGENPVSLSQCNYLEGAYLVGGTPAIKTNVDGNPSTWTPPSYVEGWVPHKETVNGPVADPTITPSPQPNAQPKPDIKPEPAPNTGTGTGTGTSTIPLTGTNPGAPGSQPGGKDCFGTSWSWNPVDWVVHPVSCALSWAFEPSKDVKTRLTTMQTQFSNKVPMTWFGVGQPIAGGACPAHWELSFRGQSYPFICGTAADSIVQGFRPILGAMLVIAAVFPLVRSLFYSSIPVMKVNPS